MRKQQHLIELNGKLYDTSSGSVVDKAPTIIKPAASGRVMDGVIHKPSPTVIKPQVAAPATPKKVRSAAKPTAAHTPQRTKTLARHAIKKPAPSASIRARSGVLTSPKTSVHKQEASDVNVQKSSKISRFGNMSFGGITKRSEAVSVAPVPATPPAITHTAKPANLHKKQQHASEKLVNEAIRNAHNPERSSTHTHHRKHRVANKLGISPKLARLSAGALAALLIVGFIAYQNAPNLSLRLAATRAGFSAHMPGYQPSGFGLSGPIEYGPGQVTLNFRSNSDERNFHVVQRVSDWNSVALLSNFVTPNHQSYQTYEDNGRTIYIYDGSNATWVNGGVWYQIEGNSSLSSDQLIRIANSI